MTSLPSRPLSYVPNAFFAAGVRVFVSSSHRRRSFKSQKWPVLDLVAAA